MPSEIRTFLHGIVDGLVLWLGEAAIGFVPLLTHSLVASFSIPGRPSLQHPLSEECVLAVVISGLALLPFFHFGPHARPFPVSWVTYVNVISALLTSVAGSAMYGLTLINDERGPEILVVLNLVLAASASLNLAMQRSAAAASRDLGLGPMA